MTRSEAARINGAKSKGPKTPEGKERSRRNAFNHGLHATAVVLSTEDPELYNELARSYFEHLQPLGPIETDLVHQIVVATWRQRRLWAMESAAIEDQIMDDAERIDEMYDTISDDLRTELAIKRRVDRSHDLDWITRTESRISRHYLRLLKTLQDLQRQRAAAAAPEPETENEQNEPKPAPPQKQNRRNEPESPHVRPAPTVLPIDVPPRI